MRNRCGSVIGYLITLEVGAIPEWQKYAYDESGVALGILYFQAYICVFLHFPNSFMFVYCIVYHSFT